MAADRENRHFAPPLTDVLQGADPVFCLELYKLFLENIGGMVYQIILDGQDRYSIQAGHYEKLTGYPKEYFTRAAKYMNLVFADDRPRVVDYNDRLHNEDDFEGEITYRLCHVDGSHRWVTTYDKHIIDSLGRHVIQGAIFDVTEQKVQALALQEAYETIRGQLEKNKERIALANRMEDLALMVSAVSHEVATPLGNTRLLATSTVSSARAFRDAFRNGDASRDDLEDFLQSVVTTAEMAGRSLEQAAILMRGFKRIAADEATVVTRVIEVGDYFSDLKTVYGPWIQRLPQELFFEVTSRRSLTTIPGYITQIILNLVNNASIHGYPEGDTGRISITVEDYGETSLRISVEDDGQGIPMELRDRIFDQHFTTAGEEGGTGLGLAISRSLAEEKLGGSLSFEEPDSGGSRFVLVLPDLESAG